MVVDEVSDDDVDRMLHALADATRRDIVRRSVSGELSVSRLADGYAMSFAAVQKHVAVLARAGLVSKVRRGRESLVVADPVALARARGALDALESEWRGRVQRMSGLLENISTPGESTPERTPTKGQDE
jgi:DNA-binding transcriptional ArsR family regulator